MEDTEEADWIIERVGPDEEWWGAVGPNAQGHERARSLEQMMEVVDRESRARGLGRDATVLVRKGDGMTFTVGQIRNDLRADSPRHSYRR